MKRAIVVGGGIAGMSAAKVLLPHYDEVLVFDGGPRPQADHLHVLLKCGQMALEDIFPGILDRLRIKGAEEVDWSNDTYWEGPQGSFPRYESEVRASSFSRRCLEELLQEELKESGVKFLQRYYKEEGIDRDLLVLAGGANFRLENFLPKSAVSIKKEVINLTYRSCVFKRESLALEDMKQYYFQLRPPKAAIGGVLCPIEGGKVMATVIEREDHLSGTDLETFYRKTKLAGQMGAILQGALPVYGPVVMRKKIVHSRRINPYLVPAKTVFIGDVLASLNPVFGQGMSLAIMQAKLLKDELEEGCLDTIRYHKNALRLLKGPVFLSVLGSKEGGPGKHIMDCVLFLCCSSRRFHQLFLNHLHFLGRAP